ncbi:Pentatricopeptide repeat [Dillenia turbinata]|uniref:Pentatricopeptide repeat n=1 Tax=Dillenia turbinata TaxID=194707 RepID=A0AAN8Z8G6_9MAGN
MSLAIRPQVRRLFADAIATCTEPSEFLVSKRTEDERTSNTHYSPTQVEILECNSQLKTYVTGGRLSNARQLFDKMPQKDEVSWTTMISGMWAEPEHESEKGELLHGFSVKSGLVNSVFVGSALLDMCMKTGKAMLGCLVRAGYHKEALAYFLQAWRSKGDSYPPLKRGFCLNSYVANTLATMNNKCGKLDYGMRLFERMTIWDVVSWTTIITTFVQTGQEKLAVRAFLLMLESDVSPNEYAFAALDFAAAVFDGMALGGIISWSTIIAGYSEGGDSGKAFELLTLMRKEGPKPNEYALASVLSVCGNLAVLEQGRQIHGHFLSLGLENIDIIPSSLINMYSKCGSMKKAAHVFNSAGDDNIVTWTTMINGYAEHGLSQEAINLFEMNPKVGLRPDSVTYIGVLGACSCAGLVDLGFHYFNSMSRDYQISPSKEHYGCMIDLLCRVGRLHDAEVMINTMPFDRDDVVWSSLLRGCSARGDVECGRRAAGKILELVLNCAGTHITMANIHATGGRWREAADIGKFMKAKRLIKEPGWSWIKVKDRLSAFIAGDRSHPWGGDIYFTLDSSTSRTDIADNSLEMVSLLYDICGTFFSSISSIANKFWEVFYYVFDELNYGMPDGHCSERDVRVNVLNAELLLPVEDGKDESRDGRGSALLS